MYVTVRYGECEEAIFNPECRTRNLLYSIRQKCQCLADEIDLCDENGNIKYLRECPNRYANEFLQDRETFVLLRVEHLNSPSEQYVPLLNDDGFMTEEFKARLSGKNTDHPINRRDRSQQRKNRLESGEKPGSRHDKLRSAKNDKRAKSSRNAR